MMADRIAHYLQKMNDEHFDVYVLPINGMSNLSTWQSANDVSKFLIDANNRERFDFGKFDCGETNATSEIALPTKYHDNNTFISFEVLCRENRRYFVTIKRVLGPNAIAIISFLISFIHIALKMIKAI